MLLSGLQMLPLLCLLLWTPKLGLSSPLNREEVLTSPVLGDTPSLYNTTLHRVTRPTIRNNPSTLSEFYEKEVMHLRMEDINSEICKQLRTSRHRFFMVFNKMKLRESVSEPSLLYRAELNLIRQKKNQNHILMLFERTGSRNWHYVTSRFVTRDNPAEFLTIDVTDVVRRWLSQDVPMEAFRLNFVSLSEEEDTSFEIDNVEYEALTQSGNAAKNSRFWNFLHLETTRQREQHLRSFQLS